MPRKTPGSGLGWLLAAAAAVVGAIAWSAADDAAAAKKRAAEEAARKQAEAKRRKEEQAKVRQIVEDAVRHLAIAFSVDAPPIVLDERTPNAASDGARILVNPRWFRGLLNIVCDDPVCDRAVAHGVLGHEMTHHVNSDAAVPTWIRDHHSQELRADFFAGRALAVFGDDIAALERVLTVISTPNATETHPAHADRLRAARGGFEFQTDLMRERIADA